MLPALSDVTSLLSTNNVDLSRVRTAGEGRNWPETALLFLVAKQVHYLLMDLAQLKVLLLFAHSGHWLEGHACLQMGRGAFYAVKGFAGLFGD